MLVMGVNPGHDGAVAVVKDRTVLFSLESEKDYRRHTVLTPMTMLEAIERVGEVPDVFALGGKKKVGAGYFGAQSFSRREGTLFGKPATIFSSSHIRSHIMGVAGMAPKDDAPLRAVLVWEGGDGTFYLLDDRWAIVREIPVLPRPGMRYALAFAIADPSYGPEVVAPGMDAPGKLMALAAYGDPAEADSGVIATVDHLLGRKKPFFPKGLFEYSPLYNAGVQSAASKTTAALLQNRLFDVFARAAQEQIPPSIPLYITGGCGLNCDWNTMWRELGHFSSVFVPPCPNDSGSALGAAIDAVQVLTGDPRVTWDVYCGLEFEWDSDPDSSLWVRRPAQDAALADALASGRIVAWVQGRWEIGPRALGNRSLLAAPFDRLTHQRLNDIKQREGYRPIAPVCRIEDAGKVFDSDFHDPYMLYFRMVRSPDLKAITHVDGSARVQTVTKEENARLHDLLSVFAERHGVGVLCNTSLNFKGSGFINRLSHLVDYCEQRGIEDMVVGDTWFQRARRRTTWEHGPVPSLFVTRLIEREVPVGATVLVITEGHDEMLKTQGRHGWHFPQDEGGTYRGSHPADSDEAIAMLEALRKRGASHIAIPASQLWWLDHYAEFHRHLEDHYRLVLQDDGCVIFELDHTEH